MISKGIILAGGTGSRLWPPTQAISKQLLPVYDKPMIYYPISVMMLAGLTDLMIITTSFDQPSFQRLLGDGSQWGVKFTYGVQDEPTGIPEAFLIAETFLDGQGCALMLGDNLFYGNGLGALLREAAALESGGLVFAKEVADPQRYGVISFDENRQAQKIEEKPEHPESPWAITGLYFFDEHVSSIAGNLHPSSRGELEITDVIQAYLDKGTLDVVQMGRGFAWLDTGTFASLTEASEFVRVIESRQGLKIGSPEEAAFSMGYIDAEHLLKLAEPLMKSGYGASLADLARRSAG